MPEVQLDDDDRKLINNYREWSRADMTPTWFFIGFCSVVVFGLVVIGLTNGNIAPAVGLAALWALVAFVTTRSTQRQIRLARLVTKLAALVPPTPADPSVRGNVVVPAEKAAVADRPHE